MNKLKLSVLTFLLFFALLATGTAWADGSHDALSIPAFTEADCEWDANGNLIRETVHDLNGAPALNVQGYHRAEYAWGSGTQLLKETYFGLNGEPVNTGKGYAQVVYTYEKGKLIAEERFAADGSRANIPNDFSYRRDVYDGSQLLSTSFYDAAGNLTRPAGGYAQIVYDVVNDAETKTVTKRYLDADGSALLGTEGCASVVSVYRKDGKLLSQAYFDLSGNKVVAQGHYHRMENTYDIKGNLVRVDYYGAEDERIIASVGYASAVMTYDELNRVVETDYLGKDGLLYKNLDGYAKFTNEYYGSSDTIHFIRYFGADNQRTMIKKGFSMEEREYNGDDFDYRKTFYDIVDEYTMSNDGYARIEWKFRRVKTVGENGEDLWVVQPDQVERERYFGTDMHLIQLKAGYAGLLNEWNGNGQITRVTY